jgi:glycosyltransferase involved in cell wall biosynthesis
MAAFDVFVFPTTWELEGFGIVPLEAMMVETPVIASKYGPVPEVVGDAAYLVNSSPKDILKAIKSIKSSPELRNNLILKGKQRIKKFDIETISKQYEEEMI